MNIVIIDKDYEFCNSLSKYLNSNGNLESFHFFHTNTDAMKFIKTHKKKIDFILFDFNVSDIDINNLVENTPKNCNLVAFSSEKKIIQEYINFPHFQRIFKKPISFSALLSFLNSKNNLEALNDFKEFFLQTLAELGFNLNHSGSTYLMEGTIFAIRNKTKKLSEIYDFLASNYDTTSKIIGWSVNNAINHAIKKGNEQKIQNFFRIYDNRKLTAKYIINHFVNSNSAPL